MGGKAGFAQRTEEGGRGFWEKAGEGFDGIYGMTKFTKLTELGRTNFIQEGHEGG